MNRPNARPSHDEPKIILDLEDEKIAEATGAAMAHVLNRPDSIRQRAQHAATISGAVAAALIVAGIGHFTGEESFNRETIALVFLGLVAWALSAGTFVYALAFVDRDSDPGEGYQGLVEAYEAYADKVRYTMRLAAVISAVALAFTVAAVCAVLFEEASANKERVRLALSDPAAVGVAQLCEWSDVRTQLLYVEGRLETDELRRRIVHIEHLTGYFMVKRGRLRARACASDREVRLSRSAVRAAQAVKS